MTLVNLAKMISHPSQAKAGKTASKGVHGVRPANAPHQAGRDKPINQGKPRYIRFNEAQSPVLGKNGEKTGETLEKSEKPKTAHSFKVLVEAGLANQPAEAIEHQPAGVRPRALAASLASETQSAPAKLVNTVVPSQGQVANPEQVAGKESSSYCPGGLHPAISQAKPGSDGKVANVTTSPKLAEGIEATQPAKPVARAKAEEISQTLASPSQADPEQAKATAASLANPAKPNTQAVTAENKATQSPAAKSGVPTQTSSAIAETQSEVAKAMPSKAASGQISAYRQVQQFGQAQADASQAVKPAPATKPTSAQTDKPAQADAAAKPAQPTGQAIANIDVAAELTQPVEAVQAIGATAAAGAGTQLTSSISQANSTAMIEQITAHVQASRDNLSQEMTIRLDPPELGQVNVQLRTAGDGLQGLIRVEHAQTLDELTRDMPTLLQKLADAGIEVKDIELRMNDQNPGRGNDAQPGQTQDQFASQADSQGRGNPGRGEAQSSPGQGSNSWPGPDTNAAAQLPQTYQNLGQYISESSINVMI